MATTMERPIRSESDTSFLTVAARVRDWAKTSSDNVAFREKNFGLWDETTWSQFWELIQDAAAGLLSLGVGVGDRVSIHSEDRPLRQPKPETVDICSALSGSVLGCAQGDEQRNEMLGVRVSDRSCGALSSKSISESMSSLAGLSSSHEPNSLDQVGGGAHRPLVAKL